MSLLPHLYQNRPGRMIEQDYYQPLNQLVPHDYFKTFQDIFQPLKQIMLKQMNQVISSMNQLAVKEASSVASDEKFQVNVDVQHFTPEEINVKVVDGYIIVEGKHKEKQDEHGFISRRFVRRYALPEGYLADTVESKLSSDGVLTVSAPKVLPLPSTGERIVLITHTGPVKKFINSNAVE